MTHRWVRRAAALGAASAGLGLVAWLVLMVLPVWVVGGDGRHMPAGERATALSSARTQTIALVTALGGLATVGAVLTTARNGIRSYRMEKEKQHLEEDKHRTGWFDSATGRLASENSTERAGAIRTLSLLMADSPHMHVLVVDTLCDVLRQYAVAHSKPDGLPRMRQPDLVAAADALRDRPDRAEPRPLNLIGVRMSRFDLREIRLTGARLGHAVHGSAEMEHADLTRAELSSATWPHARLAGAILMEATLSHCILTDADLTEADLTRADAAGACLGNAAMFGADLTNAVLCGADLRRARFSGATLNRTDFTGADLTDADLRKTDLRTAFGLTEAMIRTAVTDDETVLPSGIPHPRRASGER